MKKHLFSLVLFTCFVGLMSASALDVVVKSGDTALANCPVTVSVAGKDLPEGNLVLVSGDQKIPAQAISTNKDTVLCFIVDALAANQEKVFQVKSGNVKVEDAVNISKTPKTLNITVGGKPFTTYVYSSDADTFYRPHFYPLLGPDGVGMTRGYPMDEHKGESTDHPHHQSLWIAHGDVNGTDNWAIGSKCGTTQQTSLDELVSGPVCGQFATTNVWKTPAGDPILTNKVVFTIWGTSDQGRYVDFDETFIADQGDVKFGDTKEGGLIALRVAHTMRVDRKDGPGGHILTSEGVKDGKTWGTAGAWCDYSGPVGDLIAGLTIMDNPQNPFYPTHYHVRTYGLFTANPFGLSYFEGKQFNGSRTLKKGETWHVQYRLYIHAGDAQKAGIPERYAEYAHAPKVVVR